MLATEAGPACSSRGFNGYGSSAAANASPSAFDTHKLSSCRRNMRATAAQKSRFNVPLMLLASRFASVEQQKSLKSSSVKLAARDVAAS